MPGPAGGHCGRSAGPGFVDANGKGVPSDQLSECPVSVDTGAGGPLGDGSYRWGRIRETRLQLSSVPAKSHATVTVDAAQVRLDEGAGYEFGVFPGNAVMREHLCAQFRQPEVVDTLHRVFNGVGRGDERGNIPGQR